MIFDQYFRNLRYSIVMAGFKLLRAKQTLESLPVSSTQREIADAARVSISTVQKALKRWPHLQAARSQPANQTFAQDVCSVDELADSFGADVYNLEGETYLEWKRRDYRNSKVPSVLEQAIAAREVSCRMETTISSHNEVDLEPYYLTDERYLGAEPDPYSYKQNHLIAPTHQDNKKAQQNAAIIKDTNRREHPEHLLDDFPGCLYVISEDESGFDLWQRDGRKFRIDIEEGTSGTNIDMVAAACYALEVNGHGLETEHPRTARWGTKALKWSARRVSTEAEEEINALQHEIVQNMKLSDPIVAQCFKKHKMFKSGHPQYDSADNPNLEKTELLLKLEYEASRSLKEHLKYSDVALPFEPYAPDSPRPGRVSAKVGGWEHDDQGRFLLPLHIVKMNEGSKGVHSSHLTDAHYSSMKKYAAYLNDDGSWELADLPEFLQRRWFVGTG